MPLFNKQSYPLRTGMVIKFEKPIWSTQKRKGSYRRIGSENIEGEIVNDSYGAEKGQHTFTIKDLVGVKHRIKGRHLYPCAEILSLGSYERRT